MKNSIQLFKTSDFYTAAFLRAKGFELIGINRTDPDRVLFVFKDKEKRETLVQDFLFGRTQVEPKGFVSQRLKSLNNCFILVYEKGI